MLLSVPDYCCLRMYLMLSNVHVPIKGWFRGLLSSVTNIQSCRLLSSIYNEGGCRVFPIYISCCQVLPNKGCCRMYPMNVVVECTQYKLLRVYQWKINILSATSYDLKMVCRIRSNKGKTVNWIHTTYQTKLANYFWPYVWHTCYFQNYAFTNNQSVGFHFLIVSYFVMSRLFIAVHIVFGLLIVERRYMPYNCEHLRPLYIHVNTIHIFCMQVNWFSKQHLSCKVKYFTLFRQFV